MGGIFTRSKQEQFQGWKIHHLEMFAIIVSLRKWSEDFRGRRFGIKSDNQAVVMVINNGSAKEEGMQRMCREIAYICAKGQFEVVAYYISTDKNVVPDFLSRYHLDVKYRKQFKEMKQGHWKEVQLSQNDLELDDQW